MLTRPRQLLLRIGEGDGKTTDAALCLFLIVLLFYPSALGPQGAALLVPVEGQVHSAVEEISDNVFRFVYLLVILGAFRIQGGEVQVGPVIGALIGRHLLVTSEILSSLIDVSQGCKTGAGKWSKGSSWFA